MEKINVKELNDNVFETIGKEWMLVCAGNKDKFNMMTASWGCLGWLWNKPVAVVFIRPERYTHGIIEENEFMTLSFLGNTEEARKIYRAGILRNHRRCYDEICPHKEYLRGSLHQSDRSGRMRTNSCRYHQGTDLLRRLLLHGRMGIRICRNKLAWNFNPADFHPKYRIRTDESAPDSGALSKNRPVKSATSTQ